MYATHHVHHMTSVSKTRTLVQATVPCVLGEINHIHAIRLIGIKQSRRQLRLFGIVTVTEKRLDYGSIGIGIGRCSQLRSV